MTINWKLVEARLTTRSLNAEASDSILSRSKLVVGSSKLHGMIEYVKYFIQRYPEIELAGKILEKNRKFFVDGQAPVLGHFGPQTFSRDFRPDWCGRAKTRRCLFRFFFEKSCSKNFEKFRKCRKK
jgi:hypothetical protein